MGPSQSNLNKHLLGGIGGIVFLTPCLDILRLDESQKAKSNYLTLTHGSKQGHDRAGEIGSYEVFFKKNCQTVMEPWTPAHYILEHSQCKCHMSFILIE